MTSFRLAAVLLALAAAAVAPAQNKEAPKSSDQKASKGAEKGPRKVDDEAAQRAQIEKELGAIKGPAVGKLTAPGKGVIAEIKVPEGHTFIGQPGAAKFAQLTQNLGGDRWAGILLMPEENFMVFIYEPIGYVKDADKEKIDADGLIAGMKEGDVEANKQRKAMGVPPIFVDGWAEPPYYDAQTKNLTWAIKLKNETGETTINHRVKVLGREGVMSATLVCGPEEFAKAKGKVNPLLAGYSYTPGNTYAEWKPGDKVAEYGLAGLIAGGAVFGAAKLGLLAKLGAVFAKGGKLVVVAVVAVVAGIAKLFGSIFGGRKETAT
jgi:uncharacterized membrane-anchored protein